MQNVAIAGASLATLACIATAGLCFLVGLKDAGARVGTLGGFAKSMAVAATFSATVWAWALLPSLLYK